MKDTGVHENVFTARGHRWRNMRWRTFEVLLQHQQESTGIKGVRRLTQDMVYLTSRSLMRVGLAVDLLEVMESDQLKSLHPRMPGSYLMKSTQAHHNTV